MTETASTYITLREAASRIGRKRKTLHNWISLGRLTTASGLIRVNGRPMVEWATFERAFVER